MLGGMEDFYTILLSEMPSIARALQAVVPHELQ